MLHILLVDDEPLVLVGIQSMLKWEDYDAQIVGTARNGVQALEFIEKQKPDLIISDIKMPVMDGLQLLSAVRERYGRIPLFIMLTSFEEYSYVKTAIHLQAVDYLVKLDIDERSLTEALHKAQEQLAVLHSESAVIRRPRSERFGMQPFYDRFFVRLFNNLFESQEQFRNQKNELGIDLNYEAFVVCYCELLDFSTQQMSQEKLMSLYSSTTHIIWDTITRFLPCYVTSLDSRHFNITFCLTEAEIPVYKTLLPEILEKTTQLVFNYFSVQMLCSIGCKVRQPLELNQSYYTARLTHAEHTPQSGSIAMYDRKTAENATSDVFELGSFREPLTQAFSDQDASALEKIINQMITKLRHHPERQFQAMDAAGNLLYLCISQLNDGEAIASQIFAGEPEGYRVVYRMRTVTEITKWMEKLRDGVIGTLRERKRAYRDKTIVQIKEYIRENLDKRLTLGEVAAIFSFSPNYLSQLFAKQNDCSFVEYITQEKIQAAKEMMQSDDAKIYQISQRLGFENAFYFSKVFKKIEGCSPREYLQKRKGG